MNGKIEYIGFYAYTKNDEAEKRSHFFAATNKMYISSNEFHLHGGRPTVTETEHIHIR